MTEHEWLTSTDPQAMLAYLLKDALDPRRDVPLNRDRKLRLFEVACCRLTPQENVADWDMFQAAIAELEQFADGGERGRLMDVYFHPDWDDMTHAQWAARGINEAPDLLRDIFGNPFRPPPVLWLGHGYDSTDKMQTAVNIALAIYDDRAFGGMPILADALEEAGLSATKEAPCPACLPYSNDPCPRCNDSYTRFLCGICDGTGKYPIGYHPERDPASGRHEGGWTKCKTCNGGGNKDAVRAGVVCVTNPIIAHLRSPGQHVRGCWCLDLLLGKS